MLEDIVWSEKHELWILHLLTILIDELESCGLLVDYCDVFNSCLNSHSDGTHSLQRIHWWYLWIIVMFLSVVLTLILTAPIHCRGSIGGICGLLWCFYQWFGLSFWWHPMTAEDPLVSNWCNATFLQICHDEETNWSIFWLDFEPFF